jgi:hypothetical protein
VLAAERTPERGNQPGNQVFKNILSANPAEYNRFAIRTLLPEHGKLSFLHSGCQCGQSVPNGFMRPFSFQQSRQSRHSACLRMLEHPRLIENKFTPSRLDIAYKPLEHFDAKERPILQMNTVFAAEANVGTDS